LKLTREDFEHLVEEYLNRSTYFHDVVTWLDRILYSPSQFRKIFERELQQEI